VRRGERARTAPSRHRGRIGKGIAEGAGERGGALFARAVSLCAFGDGDRGTAGAAGGTGAFGRVESETVEYKMGAGSGERYLKDKKGEGRKEGGGRVRGAGPPLERERTGTAPRAPPPLRYF